MVPRHESLFAIPPPANLCFLYHVLLPIRKLLQETANWKLVRSFLSLSKEPLTHNIAFDCLSRRINGLRPQRNISVILKQVCKQLQYIQIKWMVIIPCFQVQFLDHSHVTPHRVLHPEAGATVLRVKVRWSISEVETPMPRFPQVASPQAICIENTQRYSTCLVGSNSWRLPVFIHSSPVFIQLLYKNYNVATRN